MFFPKSLYTKIGTKKEANLVPNLCIEEFGTKTLRILKKNPTHFVPFYSYENFGIRNS